MSKQKTQVATLSLPGTETQTSSGSLLVKKYL